MKMFTTRVELHHATEREYEILHRAMEVEGFSRLITGSNGVTYRLPPGEYDRYSSLEIETIRESAQRAASATGKNSAVLVSEAVSRAWIGLEVIQYANR